MGDDAFVAWPFFVGFAGAGAGGTSGASLVRGGVSTGGGEIGGAWGLSGTGAVTCTGGGANVGTFGSGAAQAASTTDETAATAAEPERAFAPAAVDFRTEAVEVRARPAKARSEERPEPTFVGEDAPQDRNEGGRDAAASGRREKINGC